MGLLRDYDADGLPDLFASTNQYLRLFRQVRTPGQGVGFSFKRIGTPYLTTDTSRTQPQRLDVELSNVSTFDLADVDADGDLDLFGFTQAAPATLCLFRNQSGVSAEPVFREEPQWGGIRWCGDTVQHYGFVADGTTCRVASATTDDPEHLTRARTVSAPDFDGDGDRDLFIGREYTDKLALMRNLGTSAQEVFTQAGLQVPMAGAAGDGLRVTHGPAASWLDVTFDQQPDCVLSPWLVLPPAQLEDLYDANHSAHLCEGGTAGLARRQTNFLQSGMIDVGEYAAPALRRCYALGATFGVWHECGVTRAM